jgi:hypothetical protein
VQVPHDQGHSARTFACKKNDILIILSAKMHHKITEKLTSVAHLAILIDVKQVKLLFLHLFFEVGKCL